MRGSIPRWVRLILRTSVALGLTAVACRGNQGTSPPAAPELDSPALLGATSGSQNYIHVFASAGAYPYHCKYHTTTSHRMAGTVTVDPQGPESVFVSISLGAFHPASTTAKPGGSVRWQNFDDGVHHTVTSD